MTKSPSGVPIRFRQKFMVTRIRGFLRGFRWLAVVVVFLMAISASAQTTYKSTDSIFFTNGVAAANPYPSLLNVGTNVATSVPGVVQTVTVALNNFNAKVLGDVSIMLEAPNGAAFFYFIQAT